MAGMIVLFQGRRGSGKTLSMVFHAIEYLREGWHLYSNFKFKYAQTVTEEFLLSLTKDSDLRDCVILIDEMQIFFDSRLWKKTNHISFSHFIQQIRKRNIIILGTTQYIDTIEKRIRQHVDVLIKPEYDDKTQFCSNKVYDLTTLEDSRLPEYYELIFYAPQVFNLYDTNEIL